MELFKGVEVTEGSDRDWSAGIGDVGLTGGLAVEGLNNASANSNNLLIILNDNPAVLWVIRL